MNKLLKRTAQVLGGLGLVGAAAFMLADVSARSRLQRRFETHRIDLPLPASTDQAAALRGQHLVEARYGCKACHGENLAGGVMLDDPKIGSIRGPNLTRGKGGRTAHYSMADWDRIVRHGVKPDGSGAVMPSEDFFKMSDAELSDIVAYVRAVPAVDEAVPAPSFGPVGKLLLALGRLPISAERQNPRALHPAAPPATAASAEFGAHLAATCVGCHGQDLAGGPLPFGPPDWPAAKNLTPDASGLGGWSYQDFDRALTKGVSKDGRALRDPMAAVVLGTKTMSPTEREALWTYLQSVAPVAKNKG